MTLIHTWELTRRNADSEPDLTCNTPCDSVRDLVYNFPRDMEEAVAKTDAQNDRDDHETAMRLDMQQVVRQLVHMFGATDVALIAGVQETRAVQQWMSTREPQRGNVLRFALQLALMIAHRTDARTARAWFFGSNPSLDGRVPAYLLKDRPLNEVQKPLLDAARTFAPRDETT